MRILLKTNLQWAKDEEHHVRTEKNEDEIDESHKLQLIFEYDVYLSSCTIKFKKRTRNLNWAFEII